MLAPKMAQRPFAFMAAWALAFCLVHCAGQQLNAKQQAALDLFECRVAALQPYVGGVYDTADMVRQIGTGKVDFVPMMLGLGYEAQDVVSAAAALESCQNTVMLQAPPPAPGNRVL